MQHHKPKNAAFVNKNTSSISSYYMGATDHPEHITVFE
jgi:hypothetical protein